MEERWNRFWSLLLSVGQVLSTMSMVEPNKMMHQMLGTDGGKDSVCTREFLREKMINVCQVCGPAQKDLTPTSYLIWQIFLMPAQLFPGGGCGHHKSLCQKGVTLKDWGTYVYFVRLNKMKMHWRAGTFIFTNPSLKSLLFGELWKADTLFIASYYFIPFSLTSCTQQNQIWNISFFLEHHFTSLRQRSSSLSAWTPNILFPKT